MEFSEVEGKKKKKNTGINEQKEPQEELQNLTHMKKQIKEEKK
jgi:hypothetical protein